MRPRPSPKHAQAHPGVSPLHPIANRNTSFQPLPRPLGLPPYHYDLSENFPDIAKGISKSMTFHVVGDSGGVQEEAPTLGVPVLVLRQTTERPEGVTAGTAKLIGTDEETLVTEARRLLTEPEAHAQMARAVNPYGDGSAAERIIAVLRAAKNDPAE